MKKTITLSLLSLSLLALMVVTALAKSEPPRPTAEEIAAAEAATSVLDDEVTECTGFGGNLIRNPSFEGAYSDYNPPTGHPDCQWGTCTTAQMAPEWTPYWRSHDPNDEGWEIVMPEYKAATSNFVNPPRVRSGDQAQQWFTFFATHEAGIMQTVYNVTPGENYCLSVWGHAWSSYDDGSYTDPGNHGFLNQQIGIDPTGGANWQSGNIVWTAPVTQYDEYGLFKLSVTAQSDTMTVFFHSRPLWAAKHNDVYWDDAILVAEGDPEPAVMTVDPTWFQLDAESAEPIQTTRSATVSIENNFDNLTWSASVTASSDFMPELSQNGDQLTIDIDSTGLSAGENRATIEVKASDETIEGGVQYITVQLDVAQSSPEIHTVGNSVSHMILNGEDATFNESVTVELHHTDGLLEPGWTATIDPASEFNPILTNSSGGDGDAVTFAMVSSGLTAGRYHAMIHIEGNDSSFVNSATIDVYFFITETIEKTYTPVVQR